MKNKKILYENLKLKNNFFFNKFAKNLLKNQLNGQYILSQEVLNFESNFSNFLGSKFCITVNSGLDALVLALRTLPLDNGDEVLVQSNTYIATILAIIKAGLKPCFVEPDINTYNFKLHNNLKIKKKVKALIVTHMYGLVSDMENIKKFCQRNKLYLIEDCAQAHGAKYKNNFSGTFGDFGCFSFYPTKNLGGIGDGGAIVTNNRVFEKKLKILRNYGFKKKNYATEVGFNSRLDEIQASFLNIKLKYLKKINLHKITLAQLYHKHLSNYYIKPYFSKKGDHVYHIYPVRVKNRNKLISFLKKNGIGTSIHYPVAPHNQKCFKYFKFKKKFPIADEIHKNIVSLPISFHHSEKDIMNVIRIMNEYAKNKNF